MTTTVGQESDPPEGDTDTQQGTRETTGPPYGFVLGLVVGWALLDLSTGPLRDIDVYWHLLVGSQFAAGQPLTLGPALPDWSILPGSPDWTSSQWLSESVLYWIHRLGAWPAIAAFRVVTAAIAIAILAHSSLRGRPLALAGWPFAVTVLTLAAASQERAQQFTYIGAALLSVVLIDGLRTGRLPRWWLAILGTIIWANLHGGWVLVPAVLLLVWMGRVLDFGIRDSRASRALLLAGATAAAGLVSPAGPSNLTVVWRISGAATDSILEWQRTEPLSRGGIGSVLMLLLILVALSRPVRVPNSALLAIASLLLLAWSSWRNLTPALILLTPLVAEQLTRAFPDFGRRPEPRWSKRLGVATAAALGVVGLFVVASHDHLPTAKYPFALVSSLKGLSGEKRVLNDYNVAGITLYFGGPDVRVGIDGRTDYYGADQIQDYQGLMQLRGEWQDLLGELNPSVALVREDYAIAHVLVQEYGWVELGSENGFVLLTPAEEVPQ